MRGPFVLLVVLYGAGSVPAPAQSDSVALRQVVVASEDEALQIRQLVAEGRPFDAVAAERSLDPVSASRGGYLGQLPVTDLRPEFRNAVVSLAPGQVSVPVPIADAWFVFQMVSELEARWIDLDEAGAAAENPDDPEAQLNLAEGHLADGDGPSAGAAATRAIDLGTTDSQALYLLGTALVRQGRRDEGMEQLREFQSVETEFLDLEHENREVDAIGLAAIAALRDGNPEEAVESLIEGIRLYPDAGRLYMNMAMVQNRMGEHRAAIETYERMLDSGIGRTFLVHRNLAGEYDALGNVEASQRHRQIYLETRDAELIVYAPE